MEKKTRTIEILLLVLLVLLITFFGLKKWNTSKSEAEEKKKELKKKKEYIKTKEFIEKTATEKFGLLYPGEYLLKGSDD